MRTNFSEIVTVLTRFIQQETMKAGFQKVVLGVSGGIDSAVSCVLCEKALGAENVLAVCMPYTTSSKNSVVDAEALVKKFSISYEVHSIAESVDAFASKIKKISPLRKGNVMARMRMVTLYDISARDSRLVVGTSNKTELLLGYGTLFGDMASAINPIGDLYKTEIFELAKYLEVPQSIISKPPSADLWDGQTDEDDLGFTYKAVDELLYYMVDKHLSEKTINAQYNINPQFIEKIKKKIASNHFKRSLPIIAKISNRTIGSDFRYARDCK